MDSEVCDQCFKVLLVGDSGVGKSSLMFRYTDGIFLEKDTWQTSLFDFKTRALEIDGKNIKLQIWHARRRERFHTMTSSLASRCHGCAAIMILYDVTDRKTFDHVTGWLRLIGSHVGNHVVQIVVGNKSDLEEERVVDEEEGKRLAEEHGLDYVEVSSKDGSRVNDAFDRLVNKIREKHF